MGAERITVAVGYVRVATGSQRQREGAVYLQRQAILRYVKWPPKTGQLSK